MSAPPPRRRAVQHSGAFAAALALAAGLALVLASPDLNLRPGLAPWSWLLGYVALAPLCHAIALAPTRRRAALYGWLTGAAANLGGFPWIIELLSRHGGLPMPLAVLGWALLSAGQGAAFLLFAWLVARVRGVGWARPEGPAAAQPGRWPHAPLVVLAPLCLVTSELLAPMIFPWYMAITQAWVLPVIQIADLGGPLAVSALLAAVSGGLCDLVYQPSWRRRLLCAGGAALLVLAALVYGWVRLAEVERARADAPRLAVGLVQSNAALDSRGHARRLSADDQLRALQRVSAELERAGAEFLVWPEASYPYALPQAAGADFPADSRYRIRRGFDTPLVFGALTRGPERGAAPYNSAFLLDRDGALRARYDKTRLVLFSEYIPGVETFPALKAVLPPAAGHFSRGAGVVTLPLTMPASADAPARELSLGALICYEDVLPGMGREVAARRPALLVNLTNDTWFGDTAEPWQHLALAVYRAVEARADLVRAVTTGPTSVVASTGAVLAQTEVIDPALDPRPAEGLLAEVALTAAGESFYSRRGDLFGWLCAIAALALALPWPRRRRAQAAS
ncbi:MAG: hypothetical protein Tsb0020_12090 [Haliangiales bacterium]